VNVAIAYSLLVYDTFALTITATNLAVHPATVTASPFSTAGGTGDFSSTAAIRAHFLWHSLLSLIVFLPSTTAPWKF
jgi:hypothetical protein